MNILLVYPDYPDTFWSFKYALQFVSKKVSEPPLGLLTAAALLPEKWEKKLVQMRITPLKNKDLEWADMVFISAMSIQKDSAHEVIRRCKERGLKVVAGGPLFTTLYEEFDDVDYLILNEAEITLPQFLNDLHNDRPRHIYTSDEFADITRTPPPLLKPVNMKNYTTMNIQYSRGCPFNCEFCNISALYGSRVRTKTKEQILTELENIYNSGWRGGVFFVDDNFIGNKTKLKNKILPAMIEWMKKKKYPFAFKTEVSINLADDQGLIQLMVESGFDSVFIGIETVNEESLAECNKIQNTNRDLLTAVKRIQNAGLQVDAGFIVGFDNDPPSIFDRLSAFIQESGIVTAMVGLLNAPRGTKLSRRLASEGRLLEDISGDNTDFSINFIPKMNLETLMNGYKQILGKIYSPANYYKRVKGFLKEFVPLPKTAFSFNFTSIKALFKSMVRLGIIGRERLHFWKLFFWTIFNRPQLFPLAITYSIYGFHFRKIFQGCLV
jgi:radical SAM superfamily enzyme YgiQ (UPF0313 family)